MPVWGQSGAPTLVIRIDDLGALHSVNEACIQTYRSGIARSVEVMPVAAWYPEAIKMLKENPGLDVGLHLVITSEWENVKWRPLTHCPSLTDENGYFYPMMFPNPAYPGQSIMEQKWDIKEIEQEFRAQIETTLKSIPQLSHLSGHMLSTGFSKEVNELVQRLAKEYNLPSIDRMDSSKDYRFTYIGYDGPKRTAEEKEASFIKALETIHLNEENELFFNLFVSLMRLSYQRKIREMKQWSEQLAAMGRERQKNFLDYCQRMTRENFIYNLHRKEMNYMTLPEQNFATRFAPFVNERNITGIMDELSEAQVHIEQNVNARMVFFDFSLKMIVLLKQ